MENGHFDLELLDKYIKVGGFSVEKHPDADLYIYGYSSIGSQRKQWDDTSMNLRGLILDGNGKIVSRAFKKFFTFKSYVSKNSILLTEGQILQVPQEKYRVLEKIDGTLAILYWIDDKPFLATQRSFTSRKAMRANEILYKKYAHLFNQLKRDRTYLFEVVNPETKVIVDYKKIEELFLIGVIENNTGMDLPIEDIGFPLPKDYTEDLDMITDFAGLQNINLYNKEGFVIVFENGLRIKIKFPWYKEIHRLIEQFIRLNRANYQIISKLKTSLSMNPNVLTNKKVWNSLNQFGNIDSIIKNLPHSHYYYGVEEWIDCTCKEYWNQRNLLLQEFPDITPEELEQKLIPKQEMEFDVFKNGSLTNNDSVMWNFVNRINESLN